MPGRLAFLAVWVLLMLLLAAGVGATLLPLGRWSAAVALGAAAASALLVAWFDMHLASTGGLPRLFAAGLLIFLVILFGLGLIDWATR